MADYSITAVDRRVVYTGSAGTGPYAFSFPILTTTDIAVFKDSTRLTEGSGSSQYQVTISSSNGTGSALRSEARRLPLTQLQLPARGRLSAQRTL
jgi:hypothetical protein